MKALIHTYIHVLLKNKKNIFFVNNFIEGIDYIDTGPLFGVFKVLEGGCNI